MPQTSNSKLPANYVGYEVSNIHVTGVRQRAWLWGHIRRNRVRSVNKLFQPLQQAGRFVGLRLQDRMNFALDDGVLLRQLAVLGIHGHTPGENHSKREYKEAGGRLGNAQVL